MLNKGIMPAPWLHVHITILRHQHYWQLLSALGKAPLNTILKWSGFHETSSGSSQNLRPLLLNAIETGSGNVDPFKRCSKFSCLHKNWSTRTSVLNGFVESAIDTYTKCCEQRTTGFFHGIQVKEVAYQCSSTARQDILF